MPKSGITPYRVVPLSKSHERDSFACGSAVLDRYLHRQARQDADKRVAAPFVLVEPPAQAVLGYYTLSASIITIDELPFDLGKRLPRYPHLPVTLLGRLAVELGQKRRGLGEFMLMDALRRSLEASASIASMAVVVDAKDATAETFYRRYDFKPLQRQPGRLFLPMKTMAELFAA